jgi:hypothetical protein
MSCKELNTSLRPNCIDQENSGIFKPHNESIGHYRTGTKCSRFHMNVNDDIDKEGTYNVGIGHKYQDAYNYQYNNNGVEYEPGESKIGKTGHSFEIENNKYVPSYDAIKIQGTPYTFGINNYENNIEKGKCYEKKRTLRMNYPGKCSPTHNQKAQCPPNIVPFKFDEKNILQIKEDVYKKNIEPIRKKIDRQMKNIDKDIVIQNGYIRKYSGYSWSFFKNLIIKAQQRIKILSSQYKNNKQLYDLLDFNNINNINKNNINQYPDEFKRYYDEYNNNVNNAINLAEEKQRQEYNSNLSDIIDSNDNYFGCDIDNIENSGSSCNIEYDFSYTLHECGNDCHNFTEWSECTKPCAGGIQTRECTDGLGQNSNSECEGEWIRSCNEQPCSIDCVVSGWSEWTNCAPCNLDKGEQSRYRNIILEPQYEGSSCPHLEENRECDVENDCYEREYSSFLSVEKKNDILRHIQNIKNLI